MKPRLGSFTVNVVAALGLGCAVIKPSKTPSVNRHLNFHLHIPGFLACSPRSTTIRQLPAAQLTTFKHSPPKGMSSLSVLGVASDASHRITVFLAAPMLMMRRFHPLMFAVACGTSLRTAIPSSMTMFMMMQCHLSMLGSTESCRQVPMMCHVWGSDDVIPRSE